MVVFRVSLKKRLTALLRHNLHTMQFTHLKCKIQWFRYIHRLVQPSPQLVLEHFHHPPKETLTHSTVIFQCLHPDLYSPW